MSHPSTGIEQPALGFSFASSGISERTCFDVSNVRNQRVFVTVTSSTKFRSGIAQDHLHHISIRSANRSSSGITCVVTSPLTSTSGLRPRFFRLISGSLRWRAYLSTLDCAPPGGRPVLKNQSRTSWGHRTGQNHLTSAVGRIVEALGAWLQE